MTQLRQKLISATEVAEILDEDVRTVQRKAQAGEYPAQKMPGLRGAYVFAERQILTIAQKRAQISSVPEATPPAVSVAEAPTTPVLDAVPDPGVEGGGVSASAPVSGSGAEDSSAA